MLLMNNKPKIGLIGTFQNGKSTLVNCLLGRQLAKVGGQGLSVTSINTRYTFGTTNEVDFVHNDKVLKTITLEEYLSESVNFPTSASEIVIHFQDDLLEKFDLIDTPGFNANELDTQMAKNSLLNIDIVILVLRNKSISQCEYNITKLLSEYSIPFFILVNTYDEGDDLWYPYSKKNREISRCIWNDISSNGIKPIAFDKRSKVLVVNLIWYWLSIVSINDNKSIQLSQKKLKFFWKEYFDQNVTTRSLLFKSNFNELFYKINRTEFIRCAIVARMKKEQSSSLNDLLNIFSNKWSIVDNKICDTIKRKYYDAFESEKRVSLSKIHSLKNQIRETLELETKKHIDFSRPLLGSVFQTITSQFKSIKLKTTQLSLEETENTLIQSEKQYKLISEYISLIFK